MLGKKIFIVAGGSGGHILPALQLAHEWKQGNPQGAVYFFTGTTTLERKIIQGKEEVSQSILCKLWQFSVKQWWTIPIVAAQAAYIFIKTAALALWHQPEKVISTGGILSIPVCLAVRLIRKPVEIYELNVEPGKAIKMLMPFSERIYTTFPQTQKLCKVGIADYGHKCHLVTYPTRLKQQKHGKKAIFERINRTLVHHDNSHLFAEHKTTVFILGGSQGSKLLNTLIQHYLNEPTTDTTNLQIIHQTGPFEEITWTKWYAQRRIPAFTFGYDERIDEYYTIADVIVCRAGAGTLFEIALFGKPCLVIPLVAPTTKHQINNAYAMAEQYPQLFTIIEQKAVGRNIQIFSDALTTIVHSN